MKNELARGAIYLLLGELLLAVMAAIVKHASQTVSQETLVFTRNLFGLMFLLPIVAHYGVAKFKTQCFKLHLIRATTGITAMYGYFYVITHLPLAEATLVKLSSPFFLPLVALLWLGEKISTRTMLAIFIGFLGVLLVLRPGAENFQPVALIGIASALLASIAKVAIRRMAVTEPEYRIVFYFAVLATTISAIPCFWAWQTPPLSSVPWLVAMGLAGTSGQLLMTSAYRIANPGQIGPYTYSAVVYAAIMGWLIWDEMILLTTFAGSCLIVFAGILNMRKRRPKSAVNAV